MFTVFRSSRVDPCNPACVQTVQLFSKVIWMGGDGPALRYTLDSEECCRFKVTLNECAQYTTILKKHLAETGQSLEDL